MKRFDNRMIMLTLVAGMTLMLSSTVNADSPLDDLARDYVRLTLKVGQYDHDLVDAYCGPDEFKPEGPEQLDPAACPIDSLLAACEKIDARLQAVELTSSDRLGLARQKNLAAELRAVHTRLRLMNGEKLSYDLESKLIYDVIVPQFSRVYFDSLLAELIQLIPGEGDPGERWKSFKRKLEIPTDKMAIVIAEATAEVRRRTLEHFKLPADEKFSTELVNDVSWGAYNWYLGGHASLIQYNIDSPWHVADVIGVVAH